MTYQLNLNPWEAIYKVDCVLCMINVIYSSLLECQMEGTFVTLDIFNASL